MYDIAGPLLDSLVVLFPRLSCLLGTAIQVSRLGLRHKLCMQSCQVAPCLQQL